MIDPSQILSMVGGAAGTAIGGPLGGMVGTQAGKMLGGAMSSGGGGTMGQQAGQAGAGLGVLQMMQGMKSKKEADNYFPSYEDPRQLALLTEIQQKRKSLETGADFSEAVSSANQAQAATQAGIVKSTGGDVGGTIQGLLQSERNTAGARNQAYAQGAGEQRANTALYQNILNGIEARKLQLGMQQSQQKRAEWAQSMKEGKQNFLTGLAKSQDIAGAEEDANSGLGEGVGADAGFGNKSMILAGLGEPKMPEPEGEWVYEDQEGPIEGDASLVLPPEVQ